MNSLRLVLPLLLSGIALLSAQQPASPPPVVPAKPAVAKDDTVSYEKTRETLQKWAETEKRIMEDRRDWDEIAAWAAEIAAVLDSGSTPRTTSG
jgi:hypothetical protein